MIKFDSFSKTPLAHRGLHDTNLSENSLGAFKEAVNHGYGIEMDVHTLKDGGLAVVHDNNLKRVTGFDVNVEDLAEEDLKKYPLLIGGETIPTFKQLLEVVAGKVPLLVELKVTGDFNPELPKRVLKALEGYPNPENIALESFQPYCMKWLRQNTNEYPLGQLASSKLDGQSKMVQWLFRTLRVCKISKPDFIAYDVIYLPNRFVKRARKKGYPIVSWTVNSLEKYELSRKIADTVIFEQIRPSDKY